MQEIKDSNDCLGQQGKGKLAKTCRCITYKKFLKPFVVQELKPVNIRISEWIYGL